MSQCQSIQHKARETESPPGQAGQPATVLTGPPQLGASPPPPPPVWENLSKGGCVQWGEALGPEGRLSLGPYPYRCISGKALMAHKILFLNTQLFPSFGVRDTCPAALMPKRLKYRVLTTSVTRHAV